MNASLGDLPGGTNRQAALQAAAIVVAGLAADGTRSSDTVDYTIRLAGKFLEWLEKGSK
jgi:hypothetical protein